MKSKVFKNETVLFLLIIVETFCLIVLVGISAYLLKSLYIGQENLISAGELRYESYLLADQLRQSSDDLTRLVRTYAATGNLKVEQQFWDVLAIRNGEKPRPVHYERIYWDFMTVENPQPPFEDGEAISLERLMMQAGFTEQDFEFLVLSRKRSDKLVELEETVMNAMKGKFKDEQGNFTITGEPDSQKAIQILFGKEYHQAKLSIMQPINEFYESIDNRTQQNITRISSQVTSYLFSLIVSFGGLFLIGCLLLLTNYQYHQIMVGKLHVAIDDKTQKLIESNENFKKARREADAANQAKSAFLANMSH